MKKTEEDISKTVAAMAKELEKAPSGAAIIERLLTGQVLLQRENAEQKAMIGALTDQVATLTKLVDSHQHAIEILSKPGGIVQ
ncbi:hypothetical protein [Edaphobacter aggregans]|uniref:hypothetical protein n=1 Tax=Edaphobacter aggregans TaxID=570835 RepID=UPI000550B0D6|nr:hypothetical protein [Edaphobacter aggregans]